MSKKEKVYAFIDSQNLNLGVKNDIYEYKELTIRGLRNRRCDKKRKNELIKSNKYKNSDFTIKYKGYSLDFKKLYSYLSKALFVEKAFIFIGNKPGNEDLYLELQKIGYTLVFKPTLEQNGIIKGNCDAELVLHSMIEYPNYDKAIIISGDGDFHCLAKYLISQNKLKNILIPNKYAFSSLLRQFNIYNKFINKLKSRLKTKE